MKLKFLLLVSVLSTNAFAVVPDELLDISCRSAIEKVLKKSESKDKWVRTIDPQVGVQAYRSPTKKFAKWIEIQTFENPYVFVFENQKTRVYQFDKKTCVPLNDSDVRPLNFLKAKKEGFTDKKLQALVESDKPSMIYIWSPSMVYSMREMQVFRDAAKKMNVEFVPVLDFTQPAEHAKKALAHYGQEVEIQKFQSLELYMREGDVHFPSTFVVGYNRISDLIFGALTPELLEARLHKELMTIQQVDK